MRILVAGGAGFIGSNMVAMLAAVGHQPIVYDNLSKGHKATLSECDFVKGDLANFNLLVQTLKDYRIDAVMHFAAFIEAGESVRQPLKYYQNNVSSTQVLLAAMEEARIEKLVFSSTAAVYGLAPARTIPTVRSRNTACRCPSRCATSRSRVHSGPMRMSRRIGTNWSCAPTSPTTASTSFIRKAR